MEVVTFLQSVEPHKASNDKDTDGVQYKDPIENHESDRDVVPLDYGTDRERKCNEKHYPQDHSS